MPKVYLKFFEDAVERTEDEIRELAESGLVRDDPSAPADSPKTPAPPLPVDLIKKEQ